MIHIVRKRSNYKCPKCGKPGFIRYNPFAIEHFDAKTGRTKRCYVKRLIAKLKAEKNEIEGLLVKQDKDEILSIDTLSLPEKEHVSVELPLDSFGENLVFMTKLDELHNDFIKSAEASKKFNREYITINLRRKCPQKVSETLTDLKNT